MWFFTLLRSLDQLDLFIGLSYVTLLTIVGVIMLYEGLRAEVRSRRGRSVTLRRRKPHLGARASVQTALQALEDLRLRHRSGASG